MAIKKNLAPKMVPMKPGKMAPPPAKKKTVSNTANRPMNTMGMAPSALKNRKI